MPLPDYESSDYEAMSNRVHRKIMDTVSNVAVKRGDLPEVVHVLVRDELTGERFGSYVHVEYVGQDGTARITRSLIGILKPGVSLREKADNLIKNYPGTPLICDMITAQELAGETTTWVSEDHYSLQGTASGTLEVYTPVNAEFSPEDKLPPGTTSLQIFTE